MKKIKSVAIAILLQRQKVLLAWRDEHLHQGGRYEFAGGKIEQGETAEQACKREIMEEVGIELNDWLYFDEIVHEYDDVIVHLHIYQAVVPVVLNSQIESRWQWVERSQLLNYEFPSANQKMIQRLMWQPYIKISANLDDLLQLKDDDLLYWRVDLNHLSDDIFQQLEQFAVQQPHLLARCIINETLWKMCSEKIQSLFTTLHLKHQQLLTMQAEQKVAGMRYLVACHDKESLQKAVQIGADAVLCSPIFQTATHPEQHTALGWQTFAEWVKDYPLPVFALGGLQRDDLTIAQTYGAYGIAGVRGL